jgi:hypothetical protein
LAEAQQLTVRAVQLRRHRRTARQPRVDDDFEHLKVDRKAGAEDGKGCEDVAAVPRHRGIHGVGRLQQLCGITLEHQQDVRYIARMIGKVLQWRQVILWATEATGLPFSRRAASNTRAAGGN